MHLVPIEILWTPWGPCGSIKCCDLLLCVLHTQLKLPFVGAAVSREGMGCRCRLSLQWCIWRMWKDLHGQAVFHTSHVRQARPGWGIFMWLPTAQSKEVEVLILLGVKV